MNDQHPIAVKVKETFQKKFNKSPSLYFAPGRINLLGEHVDYNDGFVMPCAVDKGIYFALAPNHSDTLNFYARDFSEKLSIPLNNLEKKGEWENYVLGVVHEMQGDGKSLEGFDCVFSGSLPQGGGMSSSAAITAGLAFGLNDIFQLGYSRMEMAVICMHAERVFAGVNCGIMDPFASLFGKKDEVLYLDCKDLSHDYIPLDLEHFDIVLINSKVKHALGASEYNTRRKECETGLEIIRKHGRYKDFRDIRNPEALEKYEEEMGKYVYKRCKYVVGEIQRTMAAAKLLKKGKIEAFGQLMFETHEGLRDLYKVSCSELDFLVKQAEQNEHVAGSRMMGGGFGGCSINLVHKEHKEKFVADTLAGYKKEFQSSAESYTVHAADGARKVVER